MRGEQRERPEAGPLGIVLGALGERGVDLAVADDADVDRVDVLAVEEVAGAGEFRFEVVLSGGLAVGGVAVRGGVVDQTAPAGERREKRGGERRRELDKTPNRGRGVTPRDGGAR